MEDTVKIISDGVVICEDTINAAVRSGAYNSKNWHIFSEMIVKELRQQHDVTFFINQFSNAKFKWQEWLYITEETIYNQIMMVVRWQYSHFWHDLPTEVIAPLIR